MNSIENLKQYENSSAVDKVVGLAVEDSIAEQNLKKNFTPNFEIKNFAPKTLFQLTKSFPTAFYIRNDSVIVKFSGELPCSYVFFKTILEQ
ncbi:MAG: hypothetical protein LBT04_03220 [Prevotellaceae bacterium]|jgi:hypothetical protein|nr:hypothetical protein [Prevotellaceae bacterium]